VPERLTRVAPLTLLTLVLMGCGGAIADSANQDGGTRRDGGHGAAERDGGNNRPPPRDAGPADDFPVFREDACPDAPFATPPIECDPFVQGTSCPLGQGCYPIPPRAMDNCHPGSYSTACLTAGRGMQGAPCAGSSECAAGFVCVITGAGDQCVKLCRPSEIGSCTDGRICRELDLTGSGWGGCE
jgi:hypothetical protein